MPLPHAREARRFYQSAFQRLEDAEFLLAEGRTTAAVYLAGYAVECMLKALLLNTVAEPRRKAVLDSFRGARAHDYGWLRTQYYDSGGARFPPETLRAFNRVGTWSTDLRYQAGRIKLAEARDFVQAARNILAWADKRL